MATDLVDIRAGLAANLAVVYEDLSAAPEDQVRCSPYMFDAPITGKLLQIKGPEDVEYNESMGRAAMTIYTIIIQGFAGTAIEVGAQTLLDSWVSPSGIKAAIEANRTLSGKVHDCTVERCRHYGMFHLPSGMSFLGAEWTCAVYVPGS